MARCPVFNEKLQLKREPDSVRSDLLSSFGDWTPKILLLLMWKALGQHLCQPLLAGAASYLRGVAVALSPSSAGESLLTRAGGLEEKSRE